MTRSAVSVEQRVSKRTAHHPSERDPSKRAKYESQNSIQADGTDLSLAVPSHPLGVKPSGNAYTATRNLKEHAGLFAALPDELLLQVLEYVDAPSLLRLGGSCRALHAFARVEDFWKAFLLEPFQCSQIPLTPFVSNIPERNRIKRYKNLSTQEFLDDCTDEPFILTQPVREWPVHRDWSTEDLIDRYGEVVFRAEAVDWPLRIYVDYMNSSTDESPLYLFDSKFVEKMGISVGKGVQDAAYWSPECFGEDLFSVLEDLRPDSRWLIVGPKSSGSTFHKDPNGTSAWNAVLRGSKYWIMFPSSSSLPPPPGVFVSADQSEVTSPLSIAEWLLGFHAEARATPGCVQGICAAGEVLHVPSGWYHLVVNLEPSIAITQNFVPETKLYDVMEFLRTKPEQVSGFPKDVENPFRVMESKLELHRPDLLDKYKADRELLKPTNRSRWEAVIDGREDQDAGFSFGFGDDIE
ncbi:MAG: hypothetical protein M1820_002902 [Bogoriella megaspora]|nr:MAG: hypothetical protein M1820_002902 [Bogoriella megaspora]